jgi:hypothetical protein
VNGHFLASGDSGRIHYSPNGVGWTEYKTASSNLLHQFVSAEYSTFSFAICDFEAAEGPLVHRKRGDRGIAGGRLQCQLEFASVSTSRKVA